MGGGPMLASGTATSRGPIIPGIFPRLAALETVNLAPPDDAANGEVCPGVTLVEGRTPGRSGGSRLVGAIETFGIRVAVVGTVHEYGAA